MPGCGCELEQTASLERRALRALLAINAAMFLVEAVAGWLGQSTGLLADSLDMLADASVYAIALWAVGRSTRPQAHAATVSGVLQVGLGLGVLVDVLRRLFFGSEPLGTAMIGVGALALVANVACLLLLVRHRQGGVHMRASWIFSTNDVIANLGVILSGALVAWLHSPLPDLVIGTIISLVVFRGGIRILFEAREARAEAEGGD